MTTHQTVREMQQTVLDQHVSNSQERMRTAYKAMQNLFGDELAAVKRALSTRSDEPITKYEAIIRRRLMASSNIRIKTA